MSIERFIKEQKGVFVTDSIISILIILLSAGIILTLIVNITLESTKVKINSQQMDLATGVLEYAEKLPYKDVTEERLIEYVNGKSVDSVSAATTVDTLTTPYKIGIKVETYGEDEGKLGLIKIVKLTVVSNLNGKDYNTEMSLLKKATVEEVKEILEDTNT